MKAGTSVLVAGGTGKLGVPIVRALCQQDCHVTVPTRSIDKARALFADIPPEVLVLIESDLAVPDGPGRLMEKLAQSKIAVNKLVYSARSMDSLAVGQDGVTERSKFLSELEFQVVVPYQLAMGMARTDLHSLNSVVLLGSQYGVVAPNPSLYDGTLNQSPIQYGVAKAALHHLTCELAVRLGPGVRVNAVAFGGFEGRSDKAFRKRYAEMVPMRRMLRAEEAGGPVLFLLSDQASSVSGHVLVADGGWTIW